MAGMETNPTPNTFQTGLIPGPDNTIGVIAAIAKASSQVATVAKVDKADIPTAKGRIRYNYRSADAVWTALAPVLHANQLVVATNYRAPVAQYQIYHADGSSLAGEVVLPPERTDPKGIGAAMSYASKYWLSQVFALPFDDPATELDGNDYAAANIAAAKKAEAKADATRVKAARLLERLQALPDPAKAEFKAEAAERDGAWSFAAGATWTDSALAEATKLVEHLETGEPVAAWVG